MPIKKGFYETLRDGFQTAVMGFFWGLGVFLALLLLTMLIKVLG